LSSSIGLVSEAPLVDIAVEKRHATAKNPFGAVRRNDVRGVQALVKMRPVLSTTGADGLTALEYPRSRTDSRSRSQSRPQ
jgi:hypothetical protein